MGSCCSSHPGTQDQDGLANFLAHSKSATTVVPPTNVLISRTGVAGGGLPATIFAFADTNRTANAQANVSSARKTEETADGDSPVPWQQQILNGTQIQQSPVDLNSSSIFFASGRSSTAGLYNGTSMLFSSKKTPGNSGNSAVSDQKIAGLFDRYREKGDNFIQSDGVLRLCQDLKVQPDDFLVLLLAWKFRAAQMCRFSKEEFIAGCLRVRADSIKAIQARFPEWLAEVQTDPEQFKDLYRFTYRFALDSEMGQRTLSVDMAMQLWKLVFSARRHDAKVVSLVDRWLQYLKLNPGRVRGIPRDTWQMFLTFIDTVDADFNGYSAEEAWPTLFDDFVEFETDLANHNTSVSPV